MFQTPGKFKIPKIKNMPSKEELMKSLDDLIGVQADEPVIVDGQVTRISEKHYTAIILRTDIPNSNKRIYPKELVERICKEAQPIIKNRGLMGINGVCKDSIIHLNDVSHLVTNMKLDGDCLKVEIELLDTPCGKILKQLLETSQIRFRPNGIGSGKVDENGILVVGDSYKFITTSALPVHEAYELWR